MSNAPSKINARDIFQLPSEKKITARTSTMTKTFIEAVVPIVIPSEKDILQALSILGLTPETIQCAFCGNAYSEWDHLMPLVNAKKPTGYFTEIGNLVPSCGKCNQSKGNKYWRSWMLGPAKKSPASRRVVDLKGRIKKLENYEKTMPRTKLDFEELVSKDVWEAYWNYYLEVVKNMSAGEAFSIQVKGLIEVEIIKLGVRDEKSG